MPGCRVFIAPGEECCVPATTHLGEKRQTTPSGRREGDTDTMDLELKSCGVHTRDPEQLKLGSPLRLATRFRQPGEPAEGPGSHEELTHWNPLHLTACGSPGLQDVERPAEACPCPSRLLQNFPDEIPSLPLGVAQTTCLATWYVATARRRSLTAARHNQWCWLSLEDQSPERGEHCHECQDMTGAVGTLALTR